MLAMEKREREGERAHSKGKKLQIFKTDVYLVKFGMGEAMTGEAGQQVKREMRRIK